MSEQKTFSISVRLRRTIFEEACVSVPVDRNVVSPDSDGELRLDGDKVMKAAIRLGADPSIHWSRDGEPNIDPHPIQKSPR